jgi:hypothetical protein
MSLPGIAEGFTDQGSLAHDNLIAGEFPRITRVVTITGGATLPAGSVLGRVAASGAYVLSDAGENDGSEEPDAILAHDTDASLGDVQAHVYLAGEFNADALTIGPGHSPASVSIAFRERSIFLRNNQA